MAKPRSSASRRSAPAARSRSPARPSAPSRARPGAGATPPAQGIVPYLCLEGAERAIEYYERAFGAKQARRELTPDGKVLHCSLRIGPSAFMLAEAFPGSPMTPPSRSGVTGVMVHLNLEDVDGFFARAVEHGATAIMPPADMFWGERYAMFRDPFGHVWSVSHPLNLSPAELAARREAAMKAFSGPRIDA